MAHVLVVEDDTSIREAVAYQLAREGYHVQTAADGVSALQQSRAQDLDLVILDLMIPRLAGLDVLRILREESQVWVIVMTARDTETDRVTGLDLGADDYVTKPFSTRELIARVRAGLRRQRSARERSQGQTSVERTSGSIQVDVARHEVWRDGEPVMLSPKEFELLAFLVQNPNLVCTRDQILETVWGYSYGGGTRTVDVHMHWLRQKLEDDPSNPRHLITVRQYGYRFVPVGMTRR